VYSLQTLPSDFLTKSNLPSYDSKLLATARPVSGLVPKGMVRDLCNQSANTRVLLPLVLRNPLLLDVLFSHVIAHRTRLVARD
jgi:hypothetical protein